MDELLTGMFIPDNEQQAEAYETEANELFFGGKAGTGKSYLILGLAAFEHTNSVIFRREFMQHRGGDGLIAKSKEIIGGYGRYNESTGIWSDVFGEGTIELAGLDNEKAVAKHKGRARDLYAFDEITEFTRDQYETIIAWNRTTKKGQRTRVVATGNPPTSPEGEWVTTYWGPWLDSSNPLYPYPPGKLVWFARIKNQQVFSVEYREWEDEKGNPIKPRSRTFIPGEMVSYLRDTGYFQTLQNLREPLRSKLLFGDFQIKVTDDPWQVIPTAWVEAAQERWKKQGKPDRVALTAIGVDVSRGGKDEAPIAKLYGTWFDELIVLKGHEVPDGPTLSAATIRVMETPCRVNIDIIGVGSSPYDALIGNGVDVYAVDVREASAAYDRTGRFKMKNKRAELIWMFAEHLDPESGRGIALPPDNLLKRDLTSYRFKLSLQGIQVESKDEQKIRLGRSPDRGEAVILAWNAGNINISLGSFYENGQREDDKERSRAKTIMGMKF